MSWSTRELGYLAGTTVNTIRHYHRIGLLDEPERQYNGYKQYDVRHLVSLLRIRRLVTLGVPLSQIPAVSAGAASTPQSLREIDAELSADIARLEEARASIAAILRDNAPADVPAGFESVASRMSELDTSITHVYSQLLDEKAMADVRKMVESDPGDLSAELAQLPADADEDTRHHLAERYATTIAQNIIDYPWLAQPGPHLARRGPASAEAFVDMVPALFNAAQQDVLVRAAMRGFELADAIRKRGADAAGDESRAERADLVEE
ncbi:MerR family transcriptional regulator [Microbacterium sp. zg.Y625]|uniref:helix-turn-helix domain-containing protein n=1 Tax=Microbacterium jiangjiandongii TaxID=3049071 RepID=UPI00214AC835|nr:MULTISPECIES: MerR family transcriptional regulator [unclassified Microbacterium]MCR2792861.1 MerR family transcriptional regulator [Microbacterium sp. zg.Y625]MCR2814504.1 MerR family transcriptional regulator [Microbacterium sp. zg.Y843]WIM26833.1 MerR family transcriptional regulator [Microbacterium sp. zg-Y625]